jgi:small subunit ribosomal protein S1
MALVTLGLSPAAGFLPANRVLPAPPAATSPTALSATAQLTKFDRIAAKWKGKPKEVDTSKAGFTYEDFSSVIEQANYQFSRGDVVQGTVLEYGVGGEMIDIGAKSAAYMPLRECALMELGDVSEAVDIDETRDFQIISDEDENGQLLLSIRRLEFAKAWESVLEQQAEDKAFDGTVIGVNRGGAIVEVNGLRAFLPGSHLCGALPTEDIIGQSFRLKFLEVNQENNKLVVSNRRAVVEDQMQDLSRGDVVQGIVKAIKPYGAFVEVNGMSGLLHISQISYDRIEDLASVINVNTIIKCMIIDHDKVNGRIALSTKTLEPEPGDMIKDSAKVFELADETAAKYHERMEAERRAREEAAKDIVMGLGDDLDSSFSSSSDLEQILNPKAEEEAAAAE